MTSEPKTNALPGAIALLITLILWAAAALLFFTAIREGQPGRLIGDLFLVMAAVLFTKGFFTNQPNQAVVLTLFGAYVGTVRDTGWWWTNPFNSKRRISLRAWKTLAADAATIPNKVSPIPIVISPARAECCWNSWTNSRAIPAIATNELQTKRLLGR